MYVAFCKLEGERKGLAQLLSMKKASGQHLALCPPKALFYLAVPLEGKLAYECILDMARKTDPHDAERFKKMLEEFKPLLGFDPLTEWVSSLSGDSAIWALGPAGGAAMRPEFQAALGTKDEASAKQFAERIEKFGEVASQKKIIAQSSEYKGRICRWFAQVGDGDIKFDLCWCADKNRILVSTSQTGLQELLRRVDSNIAGLDAAPDFKRLTTAFPESELGGTLYLNTAALLPWAYSLAMPILTDVAPDAIAQKLRKGPASVETMLIDFPGTLFSLTGTREGLSARSIGGLPSSGLLISVPLGIQIGYYQARRKLFQMEHAAKAQEEAQKEAQKEAQEEGKEKAKEESSKE